MVNDDSIKIVNNNGKIITFKELFERDKQTRIEQAKLPFEEKIRILVALQKLAVDWGNKKDVIIWQI